VTTTRHQRDTDDLTVAVSAAQAGDEAAFRAVYRQVQPGLLRCVRALVGDDAEDVTSEAWLQIARGFDAFTGTGDEFRGWAATIARHRALDHLRHTRRRPARAVSHDVLAGIAAGHDTADLALAAVGAEHAVALIAALPADQAEAVLLRVVMGLDAPAAARVLGKRPGAVRTATYRGLRRLRQLLDRMGDGTRPPGAKRD
jgi:RNA polymerase sigma-70 factor (ECF subfamily)